MKAERIVLSLIAVLIGLFVAGIIFYFYQIAHQKPKKEDNHVVSIIPSPSPETKETFLSIESPEKESVSETKIITLKGKAPTGSTVIISTENGQNVISSEQDGTFSDEVTLDEGVNVIHITAIRPDGKEDSLTHTVSYSTESY